MHFLHSRTLLTIIAASIFTRISKLF